MIEIKSKYNFILKKTNGELVDMHDIGVWVESFHIFSPNVRRTKISVSGMSGSHLANSQEGDRQVSITMHLETDSAGEFDQLKHQLFYLFYSEDELTIIRDLTPNREIHVLQENDYDIENITQSDGDFSILLTMIDPYAYGQEKTALFPSDAVTLTNEGTAEADPIFELEVIQPVTFAMIQNQDDEYQMIGRPTSVDESKFEKETSIMHETMSTLTGWAQGTFVDNGYVAGEMATDGSAFIASAYGSAMTPYAWQGPSRKTSFSETLQDFRADILVEQLNTAGETGMIEIYFLDASNNTIAKIGIEDIWSNRAKIQGKFQLGDLNNRESIYVEADTDSGWNNFNGIIRVVREGNVWRPYWAKIDSNGNHVWRKSRERYVDVEEEYLSPVAQIQVAIRKWPTTDNITQKVKDIKVYKINNPNDDQIPYVAHLGDVITFDHKKDEILINGEERTDLKAFGGQYFKLKNGENQLIVQPSNSFETSVRYRDRYR